MADPNAHARCGRRSVKIEALQGKPSFLQFQLPTVDFELIKPFRSAVVQFKYRNSLVAIRT
jgi:hypothetical protein